MSWTEWTSTLHNISLRLLRSVNTLNPTLKFKTILINKSQLLLKALYLGATLTFRRFAARHCSTAQLFGDSIRSYMLHIPNSTEGNCLTEKENHTLCLKSDIKSIKLRITKYNSEKQSRLRPPCFRFFSRPLISQVAQARNMSIGEHRHCNLRSGSFFVSLCK